MIIVIDGYNVLKQVQPSNISTKKQFVAQLVRYAYYKHHDIVLVFDGGDQPYEYQETYGRVRVVQSGYKQSADDYIKMLLEKEKGKDLLLVTSDRELRMFAQRLNIESTDSRSFWVLTHTYEQESPEVKKLETVKKLSDTKNDELEKLMEETTRMIPLKNEEQVSVRKRSGQTLSKEEKKMLKKIKKL